MATEIKTTKAPKGGTRYSGNARIVATRDETIEGTGNDYRAVGGWRVVVYAERAERYRGEITDDEIKRFATDSWTGRPRGEQTVYMRALDRCLNDETARFHVHANVETVHETIATTVRDYTGRAFRGDDRTIEVTRYHVTAERQTYADHPAYVAMLAAAGKLGLPKSYPTDLTVCDRLHVALLAHKAEHGKRDLVFAWCVRELGTNIATEAKDVKSIQSAFGANGDHHWYVWDGRLQAVTREQAERLLIDHEEALAAEKEVA